jgi:hypothetical protein
MPRCVRAFQPPPLGLHSVSKSAIVQAFIQHLYTQTKKLLGLFYLLLINMP